MDYNHNFNPQYGPSQVPPYPQPNFESRTNSAAYNEKTESNEQSFMNSILKSSVGKKASFYFSYPDSIKWRDIVYEGTIEEVGEDYFVIFETTSKNRHILLILYLNWIVFEK